ncbi:MAG: DUF86 domain-containing protein [Gemmatimonadetes bacterium]|nr:DUF86 domain-containing protein [Gemmatimonadota bacterium]
MSRDLLLYLRDIRQHCDEIADHIARLDVEAFARDRTRYKAVVFSLLVIGEAAKQVPRAWRARYTEVDWRRIAGLRDVIAHGYFALSTAILWDIVRNRVPELREAVERMLQDPALPVPPWES